MSDAPDSIWVDPINHDWFTQKVHKWDIECIEISVHKKALAEAQKWRECIEWLWFYEECDELADYFGNPKFDEPVNWAAWDSVLDIRSHAYQQFRALEKELREKEAV